MPRYKVTGPEALKKKRPLNGDGADSSTASKKLRVEATKGKVAKQLTARELAEQIKNQKQKGAGSSKHAKASKNATLKAATLDFLRGVKENNTREWFAENKAEYESAKTDFERLVEVVVPILGDIDPALTKLQPKSCIFRIFRDVRFSGGASDPYKTHMSAFFSKGGKSGQHAGYYLHIEPGGLRDKYWINASFSLVGGGIWAPPKDVVATLRGNIAADPDRLRRVLASPAMKKCFGAHPLDDDEKHVLKTAPKGYSRDHAAIDLLKYKNLIVHRKLKDTELTGDGLVKIVTEVYEAMTPFIQLLNELAGLP